MSRLGARVAGAYLTGQLRTDHTCDVVAGDDQTQRGRERDGDARSPVTDRLAAVICEGMAPRAVVTSISLLFIYITLIFRRLLLIYIYSTVNVRYDS